MAELCPAEKVLAKIPQQEPFRFIDEILELDDEHIVASYCFREDADFYRGHFPGNPITPGVILIEAMAQAGIVALGLHLVVAELPEDEVDKLVTVFTDVNVEFFGIVRPGERVITTGRKQYFRRRKLRSQVEMCREDGSVVCSGQLSGIGVPR
ncbi:MAG: beta-hydroxyacyl-ACP dehydratase [Myxococcota bacterium]